MNTYRFFWLDGAISKSQGNSPAEALTNLGYGNGAFPALDYWVKIDEKETGTS